MSKINGVDIAKKALGVVIEFGCMDIVSRGLDRLTNKYTNNVSRVAMRTGGVFLGGYLGSKASEYANETIDRGIALAKKYIKLPENKEEKDEHQEDSKA